MGGQHRMGSTLKDTIPPPSPPPSYLPDYGTWDYAEIPGLLYFHLHFAAIMSAHTPFSSLFILKVNGVPLEPEAGFYWTLQHTLNGNEGEAPTPIVTVTLSYNGSDPLFATADGHAVPAFTDFVLTPA